MGRRRSQRKRLFNPGTGDRVLAAALLCAALAAFPARGQDPLLRRNTADGVISPLLAPGAPESSYSLSGFESVNLYNGHLNVALPLLQIGGRGEAGYVITLPISRPPWTMTTLTFPTGYNLNGEPLYSFESGPDPAWWRSARPSLTSK